MLFCSPHKTLPSPHATPRAPHRTLSFPAPRPAPPCRSPQVTNNAVDPMFRRFVDEGLALANDDVADVDLTSARCQYIWQVSFARCWLPGCLAGCMYPKY